MMAKRIGRVQLFLGLANYYRRFIPRFADITAPLRELLVLELKERLTSAPVQAHPKVGVPFIVSTDASQVGIAAVLSQKDELGEKTSVYYASRALSHSEQRYSASGIEALAVVWACELFQTYITGTEFEVVTYHRGWCGCLDNRRRPNRM